MAFPFRAQEPGQLPHLPINRRLRSRLKRRSRERYTALTRAARRLVLDPLEPRVLLNADVLAFDMAAYYQDQQSHDLLVRMQEETVGVGETTVSVRRVEILDQQGGQVLAFGDLAEISAVTILGGNGDETVTFDATSFDGTAPFKLTFDGGAGADSLRFATSRDVAWDIGGPNAGTANDGLVQLQFGNVEWALGAAGNRDEFTVAAGGRMTGGISAGMPGSTR